MAMHAPIVTGTSPFSRSQENMQATHLYALRQRPLFGYWSISARRAT